MIYKHSANIYRANYHLWRQYGGCKYVLAIHLCNWSTVLKWKGMIWKKYWHLKSLTQYSQKQTEECLIWPWSRIASERCPPEEGGCQSASHFNCPTKNHCFISRPKLTMHSSLSLTINTMSIVVQQDATVYSLLYFCNLLYMFRVVTPPIIRSIYNCNYSIWHRSNRLCYSYMCSWWWVELLPEICRAVYRNIINCI